MPMLILLFKSTHKIKFYFWGIILLYMIAKFFETYDEEVFHGLKTISGHSIKHVFVALAPALFLHGLYKRKSTISL